MNDHILLISENNQFEQFARAVAETCNAKFACSPNLNGIQGLEDSDSLLAIFLDANVRNVMSNFEQLFQGSIPRSKIHLITSAGSHSMTEEVVDSPDIGHVLIANFNEFSKPVDNGRNYARIVKASSRTKFEGPKPFLPAEVEITKKEISESLQKRFFVEGVYSQLIKKEWHPKIASTVVNALDELIMNAIFDAPTDTDGQQKYLITPRSANLKLEGEAKVEIQIGMHENFFIASVTDRFGSMKRKRVLQHVFKAFSENQKIQATDLQQGAGLGLALIFRSGGSLSFACHTGHVTEVTVFFARTDTFVQFKNQFQYITTQFDT